VHDRLGHLARGDLALRDQHDRRQPGARRVGGHRGRGVPGRGAHHRLGALGERGRDGRGHAAVLERAGRVLPLDLDEHVTADELGQPARVHQRRAALAERDDGGAGRKRDPVAVLLDDSTPRGGHHDTPSTRMTDDTPRTISRSRIRLTVAASAASSASWVTTTSWASSPRPSWRTVLIDTSWTANTWATAASTPGRSSTSIW